MDILQHVQNFESAAANHCGFSSLLSLSATLGGEGKLVGVESSWGRKEQGSKGGKGEVSGQGRGVRNGRGKGAPRQHQDGFKARQGTVASPVCAIYPNPISWPGHALSGFLELCRLHGGVDLRSPIRDQVATRKISKVFFFLTSSIQPGP